MGKIWMPGSAGEDVEPVTADRNDVIQGKVIVDKDGNPLTGTIVDHDATTNAISAIMTANSINTRIPNGAYRQITSSGYPEVSLPAPTVGAAGGLTAAKLLAGQSAFGIAGSATSDANAASGHILTGRSAYVNGQKINGGIPIQNAETDGDRIWATSASNWAGTVNIGVRNGRYLNGVNWVRYDMPNYRPEYIKKGVNMGGVVGTFEGYVPSPTDLYYRGNNPAGLTIYSYDNSVTFQSGGIRANGSDPRITMPTASNFNAWNYLNLEIYFENPRGDNYWYENTWYGMSAVLHLNNGVERRTQVQGGDWRTYVISIPLSGLSYTTTWWVDCGFTCYYRHQTDDDDDWLWTFESRFYGGVYRIWFS